MPAAMLALPTWPRAPAERSASPPLPLLPDAPNVRSSTTTSPPDFFVPAARAVDGDAARKIRNAASTHRRSPRIVSHPARQYQTITNPFAPDPPLQPGGLPPPPAE